MPEFTKRERQELRKLAGDVYEAEVRLSLEELDASFEKWRSSEILSSKLLEEIHEFHQHRSRELWSMYQSLHEAEVVARGVAHGLIEANVVRSELLAKLESSIRAFQS